MDELTGPRTHNGASLRLRVSTAIPAHMRAQVRELFAFKSTFKGKGNATALLDKVCDQADAAGKTLLVTVEPFGEQDMSEEQLRKWYGKFGFQVIQDSPCLMARPPNSTPRVLN